MRRGDEVIRVVFSGWEVAYKDGCLRLEEVLLWISGWADVLLWRERREAMVYAAAFRMRDVVPM